MKFSAKGSGIAEAFKAAEDNIATVTTERMKDATDFTKAYWRQTLLSAGLSRRFSTTVQSKVYPEKEKSLDPAGLLFSKAPLIMYAMSQAVAIRPTGGRRYLAIPSENVPHKTPRRLMTPVEVEATFNQDLIIRQGRNRHKLAFVNVIAAKNKRGFRKPTKGRLAQGRNAKLVLMFTLVPQVITRKRFDLDTIAARGQSFLADALNKDFAN